MLLLTKSTELFVGYLAVRAKQVASNNKRVTLKESDLAEIIHSNSALEFLKLDFPLAPKQSTVVKRKVSSDIIKDKMEINMTSSSANSNEQRISSFFQTKKAKVDEQFHEETVEVEIEATVEENVNDNTTMT